MPRWSEAAAAFVVVAAFVAGADASARPGVREPARYAMAERLLYGRDVAFTPYDE